MADFERGEQGEQGIQGEQGEQGIQGEPGRLEPRIFTDVELREIITSIVSSVDKQAASTRELIPAMNRLSAASEKVVAKNHRQRIVIVALLVALAAPIYLGFRLHVVVACNANQADKTTHRSDVLSPDTRDIFFDFGATLADLAPPVNQKTLARDAGRLEADLLKYKKDYLANPVPLSPKDSCSAF